MSLAKPWNITSLFAADSHKDSTGARESWAERYAGWLLFGFSILFAVDALARDLSKPFWFDEVSTLLMASAPDLTQYFRQLAADAQPPLGHLLVRFALLLPLPVEIAARTPSLLGGLLAGFCIFRLVARPGLRAAAAFCAIFFLSSDAWAFAGEARPYDLLLGLSALQLLLWRRRALEGGGTGVVASFGLCTLLLIVTQPLGLIYAVVPAGLAEAVRTWRRRQPDVLLIAVWAAATLIFIWVFRSTQSTRALELTKGSVLAWPNLRILASTFFRPVRDLYKVVLVGVVLLRAMGGTRNVRARSQDVREVDALEWMLPLGLTVATLLVCVVARFYMHYYFVRYGLPFTIAASIAPGFLLAAKGRPHRSLLSAALTIPLLAVAILKTDTDLRHGTPVEPNMNLPMAAIDGKDTITVTSALQFPTIWWYATPEVRARLQFLTDSEHATRTADPVPELTVAAYGRAGTYRNVKLFEPIIADRPGLTVLTREEDLDEWLPAELHRLGYSRKLIDRKAGFAYWRYTVEASDTPQ